VKQAKNRRNKMKFLVVALPKHPVPPEMGMQLIDATVAWVNQYAGSGKVQETWSFAGTGGGGGILDVDSADELDAIMSGFPFGPFSDIQIYALADLHESLQRNKQNIQAMAGG
jgi:muconolactone delta-isomerase